MVKIVFLGKHHYDPSLVHMTEDGFVLKTVEVQLYEAGAPMLVHQMVCSAAGRPSEFKNLPPEERKAGTSIRKPIWFDLGLPHIDQIQQMMPEYMVDASDIGRDWANGGTNFIAMRVAMMTAVAWLALFDRPGQTRTVRYVAA